MDKTVKQPLVSVLMPVFNAEKYLIEAIQSIINQTYQNFEFIIVDDCSSDGSKEIIKKFTDNRIKLIEKTSNSGISETLNVGIKEAKGKYIARMDADDISHPKRIEKQVAFLERNSKYVVCGSNYYLINNNFNVKLPEENEAIKVELLKSCCIGHPTVVLKTSVLKKYNFFYKKESEPTEDYNLWIELIKKGKFYNLQESLLGYRIHDAQITKQKKIIQDKLSFNTSINYLTSFFKNVSTIDLQLLKNIYFKTKKCNKEDFILLKKLVERLSSENKDKQFFSILHFNIYLKKLEITLIKNYFTKYERYSLKDFFEYLQVYFKYGFKLNFKDATLLFLKSISFYKIN